MKLSTYILIIGIIGLLLYIYKPDVFAQTYGFAFEKGKEYLPVAYDKIQAMIAK